MDEIVTLVTNLGFPIALVLCLCWFIYKIVNRDKDEAKDREDKLIEANNKFSVALSKVGDTIEKSNDVNQELSETNRLLIDKIEPKLSTIATDIELIKENIKKQE